MNSNLINRLWRAIILAFVMSGVVALWIYYSPGHDWQNIRNACYITFGFFLVLSSVFPLGGLLLLSFCAPILSVIPLYLTKGSPYPIVLFAGIGFVIGWLINGIIKPDTQKFFKGQGWLFAFAALTLISAAGTFFRYCPPWLWKTPDFLSEIVNHKNMTRIDAVRYTMFVFANIYLGILLICATQNILSKYKNKYANIQTVVIWTILFGGACAAAFAVYQGMNDVLFCANKSYYWIRLKRVNGTCTDPNALGAYVSLCITISMLTIVFSGSIKSSFAWVQRIFAVLLTAVYLLAIQYSGSRTALLSTLSALSCAVFVGVYYYTNLITRNLKYSKLIKSLVIVFMIGFYACGIVMMPKAIKYTDEKIHVTRQSSSLMRRIKRDFRLFKRYGSGVFGLVNDKRRLMYWKYARIMWKNYPFSGIGLGAYVVELPNYTSARKERLFRVDNACNYYLHYGSEMGTPAILFMGLFFGTLIIMLLKVIRKAPSLSTFGVHQRLVLLIAMPIYLIILIFGVHTLAYEFNIAFSVILGVAASYQESDEKNKKIPQQLKDLKYIVVALVIIILALFLWRNFKNNKSSLNSERRQAAYGLKIEKGWGKWEKWAGVPFKHRWIKQVAHITLDRQDLLLGFPIISSNPKLADNPQKVTFYINGDKITETTLDNPDEWKLIQFPAPYANAFIHAFSPRVSVRIEVDKLWTPSSVSTNEDVRSLGITVGEHRWLTPAGEMGGWYDVDFFEDIHFRWSGKYAWRKVVVGPKHKIKVPFSAANILLKWWPLDVAVYFNNKYIDTVTFRNKTWKNYTYPIPDKLKTGTTGIVEFVCSKTWTPKHYGFKDPRNLGVAIGEITSE